MKQPIKMPASLWPGNRGCSQDGSALIVSLVMLLLLSLISIAGIQGTILQDRMTGNFQDQGLAFQAAEAAVREGETLMNENPPVSFPNAAGLYRVNATSRPDWLADTEDTGNGVITYGQTIDRVSAKPVYFIEELDSIRAPGADLSTFAEPKYYRITAMGYGGSESTVVVITTVFKKR